MNIICVVYWCSFVYKCNAMPYTLNRKHKIGWASPVRINRKPKTVRIRTKCCVCNVPGGFPSLRAGASCHSTFYASLCSPQKNRIRFLVRNGLVATTRIFSEEKKARLEPEETKSKKKKRIQSQKPDSAFISPRGLHKNTTHFGMHAWNPSYKKTRNGWIE